MFDHTANFTVMINATGEQLILVIVNKYPSGKITATGPFFLVQVSSIRYNLHNVRLNWPGTIAKKDDLAIALFEILECRLSAEINKPVSGLFAFDLAGLVPI